MYEIVIKKKILLFVPRICWTNDIPESIFFTLIVRIGFKIEIGTSSQQNNIFTNLIYSEVNVTYEISKRYSDANTEVN